MLFHKLMKPEKFKIESETKNLQFYRNNGDYTSFRRGVQRNSVNYKRCIASASVLSIFHGKKRNKAQTLLTSLIESTTFINVSSRKYLTMTIRVTLVYFFI